MKHIVVVPYYCADEVRRYLWIADLLKAFSETRSIIHTEFLLSPAASVGLDHSLFEAFSKLSAVNVYKCKTTAIGYPERPSAMFWEIMEFISRAYPADGGFVLWLESDMVPVRENWVDKLTAEWTSRPDLLLMGPLISQFRTRKGDTVPEHINGGSCYSKDLARHLPATCRESYFDLALFPYVKATNRFRPSESFVLATCRAIPELILNSEAIILHGYLQPKDEFVRTCVEIVRRQKEGWFQKLMRLCKARRCCAHRYWDGLSFFCPVHTQTRAKSTSLMRV
jgi:hypothetical protein